jgi:hypothetical protein
MREAADFDVSCRKVEASLTRLLTWPGTAYSDEYELALRGLQASIILVSRQIPDDASEPVLLVAMIVERLEQIAMKARAERHPPGMHRATFAERADAFRAAYRAFTSQLR